MLTREDNDLLTLTGPGTPGGEMLRRYWHPVALAEELSPGGAPLPLVPPERRRDPVDVLVWLVNHLSGRGIGLAAGQIATLGAAVAGVPMGRSVKAEIGDWGRLEATVADA